MSEWWTYGLSDFLMFSPRTYWRLVELYNRDLWPMQLLALGAGVAMLGLAAARNRAARHGVLGILVLAWLGVAWGFHWQRYSQINWAARYLAMAFVVQGMLLLACMLSRRGEGLPAPAASRRLGWLAAWAAMLVYPVAGLLAGRPYTQAEVFGLMPEPTALATLGLLLTTRQRWRAWLVIIPGLSLALGLATLWTLGNSS